MNEMQTDGNTSQKYMQSIQCLSDYREADFSNEETFDSFMQILASNADFFASQTATDTENYFSQFTHVDANKMVYHSLANSVIMYWNLGEIYAIKNKILDESIYKEILVFFQLLICSNEQIQQYDLSKSFDKIAGGGKNKSRKNSSISLEENINVLLNEVTNLKKIIMDQSKMIDQVKNENKEIKNELLKMSQKIETRSAFSFTQPMPTIPVLNTNSTSSNNKSNNTQTNSLFSSKVLTNIATPSATKRPLANQNNNSNKISKPTPNVYSNRNKSHPQGRIATFNSFNPNENSVIQIDENENEGFKTVANRRNNKKNNNFSNNGSNNNNNNNDNKINNNKNNNKRKPFRQDYSKIIGRGVTGGLSAKPKQFYIYLGKLDMSATVDTVRNFLEGQFGSVKFGENETREVKISNLKELNENFLDRTFKSFSFSVSVLDKEIVKMKDLFPLYSIVNQHRLSHAEWTAITQKFKNNRQNFATSSNQV
jgi:hypothetical protein